MTYVQHALLVLHFIGLASLLGGFLGQLRGEVRTVNAGMLHGALTMLVTGVGLYLADKYGIDKNPDRAKMALKMGLLLVILLLAWANRAKQTVNETVFLSIG